MDTIAKMHQQMQMMSMAKPSDSFDANGSDQMQLNIDDFRPEVQAATSKLEEVLSFVLSEFNRSIEMQSTAIQKSVHPLEKVRLFIQVCLFSMSLTSINCRPSRI